MVLGSAVSNFHVEFIDGVVPENIDPKTNPYVSLDCRLLRFFFFFADGLIFRICTLIACQRYMQLEGHM